MCIHTIYTYIFIFFLLFNGINLKIHFLSCNMKASHWQFEDAFLNATLPVMWDLKHFLCFFLPLLFPVCLSDTDLYVGQVRELPLL